MNAHQQARRRTWRSLFLLDSNKLTRIQNILTDRLTRNQVPPSFNCAVTLRNGTADTFQSIPDVLALDNTKRNPISSLTIIAQTPANAVSPASCTVEFTGGTKAKLSGAARDAISLSVDGQDPIAKAETFAAIEEQVERALASPLPVVFVAVSLVVLLLIGMFTMGGLRAMPLSSNVGLHSSELPELDQKTEQAKTADAKLSFLFELKRREIHSLAKVYAPVHWGELATFSGVLKTIAFGGLIAMLFYMLAFCYPMNVFLWGDYGEHYAVLKERRKVDLCTVLRIKVVMANDGEHDTSP